MEKCSPTPHLQTWADYRKRKEDIACLALALLHFSCFSASLYPLPLKRSQVPIWRRNQKQPHSGQFSTCTMCMQMLLHLSGLLQINHLQQHFIMRACLGGDCQVAKSSFPGPFNPLTSSKSDNRTTQKSLHFVICVIQTRPSWNILLILLWRAQTLCLPTLRDYCFLLEAMI